MHTENKKDINGENTGPVGKPASTPFFKIFAIIFFISITVLSYVTYKKISQFLSFLSGEINSVTAPFKYGTFSSSGTYPVPEEEDDINEETEPVTAHIPEDEGEEAERTEISTVTPEDEQSGSDTVTGSDNSQAHSNSTEDGTPENSPRAFPRAMNPVESAGMKAATTVKDGFFKGMNEFSIHDSIGITRFIFMDTKVYQFSLYPAAEHYKNAATEEKRAGVAADSFDSIIKKVQGAYYYNSKKDIILSFRNSFVKACLNNRKDIWKYAELDGYAYGCNDSGFNAVAVNALGQPGVPADKESLF